MGGFADDPTRVLFAIRRHGDLDLVGYLQLTNIQAVAGSADLGLLIGAAQDRGRGFGQEAVRLAAEFCWRDLNLQRLALTVVGANPGAVRAYEKAGFQREGLLRRAAYVNGPYQDVLVMGLLRGDGWQAA